MCLNCLQLGNDDKKRTTFIKSKFGKIVIKILNYLDRPNNQLEQS